MTVMSQSSPMSNPRAIAPGFPLRTDRKTLDRNKELCRSLPLPLARSRAKADTLGAPDNTAILVPVTTTLHYQLLHQEVGPTPLCSAPHSQAMPSTLCLPGTSRTTTMSCHPVPWCPISLPQHLVSCSLPQVSRPWLPQVLLHSPPRLGPCY